MDSTKTMSQQSYPAHPATHEAQTSLVRQSLSQEVCLQYSPPNSDVWVPGTSCCSHTGNLFLAESVPHSSLVISFLSKINLILSA